MHARIVIPPRPKPRVARAAEWPRLRRLVIAEHPFCALCGRKSKLEAHHKTPVHVDRSRELDRDNLIVLCDGPISCHRAFGHLWDWHSWNVNVVEDVARMRAAILARPGRAR